MFTTRALRRLPLLRPAVAGLSNHRFVHTKPAKTAAPAAAASTNDLKGIIKKFGGLNSWVLKPAGAITTAALLGIGNVAGFINNELYWESMFAATGAFVLLTVAEIMDE